MSETPKPRAVHILPDHRAEIHLMGEYVSVRWNVKPEQRTSTAPSYDEDGLPVTVTETRTIWRRDGGPYISFACVHDDTRDGEVWVDEDDTVSGGLSAQGAAKVRGELTAALAYIEHLRAVGKA